MMAIRHVGIDTGTRLLGWAVVGERGEYIDSGWVDLETTLSRKLKGWDSLSIRLRALSMWATRFFEGIQHSADWASTIVGIEHPWVGRSKQTALTLGMAWGIIAHAAMQCGFAIAKIEPTQAKKALTGSGLPKKQAMLEAAKLMDTGREPGDWVAGHTMRPACEGKGKFDEADALGVALATRIWALERERGAV